MQIQRKCEILSTLNRKPLFYEVYTISGDHSRYLDLRHNIKPPVDDCEGRGREKERQLLRVNLARGLDGQGVQCGVVCWGFYSLDSDDWAVFQSRVRFVVQRK